MLNKFLIVTLSLFLLAQCDAQRQRPFVVGQRRPATAVQRKLATTQRRSTATRQLNVTRLSVVVSGLEGTTEGTGTLLRPLHVPQIYAVAGKTRRFRVPLLISVNSIFIHSLRTAKEHRLCLKRNQMARLNHQINTECQNVVRLNIPLDLLIPRNVESSAIEHENTPEIIDPLALINYGPNAYNQNSRTTQDLYRMNYAVGDPVRARRVKRGPQIQFKRSNPLFMD